MLPKAVAELARMLLAQIAELSERIETLEKQVRERAARDEAATRMMTMAGIGAITAIALVTFAPALEPFVKGRDFAAWIGLTPRLHFDRRPRATRQDHATNGAEGHPPAPHHGHHRPRTLGCP